MEDRGTLIETVTVTTLDTLTEMVIRRLLDDACDGAFSDDDGQHVLGGIT